MSARRGTSTNHSARLQIALRERFNFRDNLLYTGPMVTIGCIHLNAHALIVPGPYHARPRPVLQALGLGRIGNSHRWGSLNDLQVDMGGTFTDLLLINEDTGD